MDITEAEYVETAPQMQLHKVVLEILEEKNKDTIYNIIIMEKIRIIPMANNDIIIGSEFNYKIDTSHGLSSDGYIATGTESIVYKGVKTSRDGKTMLSCVLKFKYKSVRVGAEEGNYKVVDLYEKFRSHDLKIFDELQDCRSVVRIFDVIEDLGDFSVTDTHVPEGKKSISINRDQFFCVVEE